jgi:hypothetical protein
MAESIQLRIMYAALFVDGPVAAKLCEMAMHDAGRHPGPDALVWGYISPCGTFDLDTEQRLDPDVLAAA